MIQAIIPILLGAAAKVGADLVGKVLGETGGALAETVVRDVAARAGLPVEQLPRAEPAAIEAAVRQTNDAMPEIVALWARGLDGQFALAEAEVRAGGWQAAWRPGWMIMLGVLWCLRLAIVPVVDTVAGTAIGAGMDVSVMLTLTSWFVALYMGGHTIKELGRSGVEAVRVMKGRG